MQGKIVHLINGLGRGGAEGALLRLLSCQNFVTGDHLVVSLGMSKGLEDRFSDIGIKVIVIHGFDKGGSAKLFAFLKLVQYFRYNRPKLIQSWLYQSDFLAAIISLVLRIPVVWNVRHSNFSWGTIKFSTFFLVRVNAVLSRICVNWIIFSSNASQVAHYQIGFPKTNVSVIHNGFSVEEEDPRNFELPDSESFKIFIGARFDVQKDYPNVLASLSQLTRFADVRFDCVMCGLGVDNSNLVLNEMIDTLGLREHVKLLGEVTCLTSVIRSSHICLLGSLGESFPNVVAEAMIQGRPCVATDVGDTALIVGDCGWVVPSKNPVALSRALYESYCLWRNDLTNYSGLGLKARERIILNFGISGMREGYQQVWQEVLSKKLF